MHSCWRWHFLPPTHCVTTARAGSICRTRSIPSRNYQWLLIVIIPFGPILLDLEGFYESPFNRTLGKSFIRIVRTMIYLSILVSGCVIFLRLPLTSRAVPLLFIVIATVALLIKDRMIARRISFRARRGEVRERVLLAGVAKDIAALE